MITRTQPRTTGRVGRTVRLVQARSSWRNVKTTARQDDVMRPATIAPAFEVIEAEVVFELAILLLDRPATAGEGDEFGERGRLVEVEQIAFVVIVRLSKRSKG
jgi:hypothetical protein